MRVGIRSGLASVKIYTVLLLVVVTIAMILGGSDVIFHQHGTRTVAQAPPFAAIDLNPSGFDESHASGSSSSEQVGYGSGPATGGRTHALLWHGSAASVVDLHPSGFIQSLATGTCGGVQVGYGSPGPYDTHAMMWHGSAAIVVDLHPSGFILLEGIGEAPIRDSEVLGTSGDLLVGNGHEGATSGSEPVPLLWRAGATDVVALKTPSEFGKSYAFGTSGEEQVGYGSSDSATGGQPHALLWRSTSASAVDLHPRGFGKSYALATSGGQQVGYGSGPATGGQTHALLWRGSAASVVDLHPSGFFFSRALGTNGDEQVGWGDRHALLWRGSGGSVIDLHSFLPPGFVISSAVDINATGDIVGTAWGPASGKSYHAFLWRRNVPKPATSREQNTLRC